MYRVGRRLAAVLGATVAILLVTAGPAAAHPTLLTTVPAAGYSGAGPVRQVVLAFDEPVTATDTAVHVMRADGTPIATGHLQRTGGDRQLVAPLRQSLTAGQFRVHWVVTASDGDIVDGSFAFGVGAPAPTAGATGGLGDLAGTAGLRWVLFGALAVVTGGLLGEWLARRSAEGTSLPVVHAPVRTAAVGGLLAAVGLTALLVSSAGGWTSLIHVRAVELAALESAAFAFAAAAAFLPRLRGVAALPLVAVLVAEGLRAHPDGYLPSWGAALTALHLGAAALWVGALLQVVRSGLAWRGRKGAAQLLLLGYAPVAVALYLLVATSGVLATLLVLRAPADLVTTGYGRVLAGKLALVTAVTVLAVIGRFRIRLVRAGKRGGSQTADHPGRATRLERWLLVAVLAVTAVLVSLPAPRPTTTALALPPPPIGPAAAFGTLLGQLSLGATASSGQLQLSLTAPGSDPGDAGEGAQAMADAHITATLRAPRTPATGLVVRSCGAGCFVTAAGWRDGANEVTVTAGVPGWHGGTATFSVPWPPVNGGGQFRAMLAALRRTPMLDLHEATTSDTTGPTYPTDLHITSSAFLEAEPYGNGVAPLVTMLPPRDDGKGRLALAFPASGIYITVTLDDENRPLTEVEATPNHLITRRFRYPAP